MSGTPFSNVNNIHVHSMIPEDQKNITTQWCSTQYKFYYTTHTCNSTLQETYTNEYFHYSISTQQNFYPAKIQPYRISILLFKILHYRILPCKNTSGCDNTYLAGHHTSHSVLDTQPGSTEGSLCTLSPNNEHRFQLQV